MWYDALLDEFQSLPGLLTVTLLVVIAICVTWDAMEGLVSRAQRRKEMFVETMRLLLQDDEHD